MSKYDFDFDYAIYDVDIFEENIKEVIKKADFIIRNENDDKETLFFAYIKKAQVMLIRDIIDTEKNKKNINTVGNPPALPGRL
jgi:hypothetical protein